MSAISPPSQINTTRDAQAASEYSESEIDGSCQAPVLLMFISALAWLLVSSVLGLVASLKFHAPNFLADCSWLTYGRVYPAHIDALIYGFAMQAGLGVTLWVLAHLGRARLALVPAILCGVLLWNAGVICGILGIFYGESSGYKWLEMPRYASMTVFCGYALIALGGLATLRQRQARQMYISQIFTIAALFWFPWIFTSANLLLVIKPVRGALQAGIDWWYINNLTNVWFGFIGLAAVFYFVPRIVRRPLHSQYIGIFIFWTLALFGSWGGIPEGAPLPAWMPALSTMGSVLMIVPVLAVAYNLRRTTAYAFPNHGESPAFNFFYFGVGAYVVAGLASALTATIRIGRITDFTWFVPAQTQLFVYGFFAMAMFGAIYYIVPRLVRVDFPKPWLITFHFLSASAGLLLYVMPLAVGGVRQGLSLNDPTRSFAEVTASSLLFLRISTTGDLLMALGLVVMLVNLGLLLASVGRRSAIAAWSSNTKVTEVAS